MPNVGDLVTEFTASTSGIRRGADEAKEAVREVGDAARETGDQLDETGEAGVASLAAVLAAATVLAEGIAAIGDALDEAQAKFRDLRLSTGNISADEQQLHAALVTAGVDPEAATAGISPVVGLFPGLGGQQQFNLAETYAGVAAAGGDPTQLARAQRAFGIPNDQLASTANLAIQSALATGGDPNEITSFLQRVGPTARAVGFDFLETAQLASDFAQQGINPRAVRTPLEEALEAADETGVDPRRFFERQFEAIATASSDRQARTLAQETFGPEYFIQIADAIRSGTVGLGNQLSVSHLTGTPTLPELAEPTSRDAYLRSIEGRTEALAAGDVSAGNIAVAAYGILRDLIGGLPIVGDPLQDVIDIPGSGGRLIRDRNNRRVIGDTGDISSFDDDDEISRSFRPISPTGTRRFTARGTEDGVKLGEIELDEYPQG